MHVVKVTYKCRTVETFRVHDCRDEIVAIRDALGQIKRRLIPADGERTTIVDTIEVTDSR